MSRRINSPFRSPSSISINSVVHRSFPSPERFRLESTTPKIVRNPSRDNFVKPMMINKVPISFDQRRLSTANQMQASPLAAEEHVSLYSEVERLSLLNLELKKQNDSLMSECESLNILRLRVPELEDIIRSLEQQLAMSQGALYDNKKRDRNKLEPAYNELREHNMALMEEVERLSSELKSKAHELDLYRAKANVMDSLEIKVADLERKNYRLYTDNSVGGQESAEMKKKLDELNHRIMVLTTDNMQMKHHSNEYLAERDHLRKRVEELESSQEKRIIELRNQMDLEKKAILEYERAELAGRHAIELRRKDQELKEVRKVFEEYENRLKASARQIEELNNMNFNKTGEIDELKMRISQFEIERQEYANKIELELRMKLDEETKALNDKMVQQEAHYEGVVRQLKGEINQLHKLNGVIKQKDSEIERLKADFAHNQKIWEMKLQQTVETEAKSASNVFILEKRELEDQLSASEEQVNRLETQIAALKQEIEKLNNVINQKTTEFNETQRKITNQEVLLRTSLEDQRHKLEIEKKNAIDSLTRELERIHKDKIEEMRDVQVGLEEKISRLGEKNKRLTAIIEDRVKDIEVYKQKVQMLEESYKQQNHEIGKRLELTYKLDTERQINNLVVKHNAEIVSLEEKISLLKADVETRNMSCQDLSKQLEGLKAVIKKRESEIQDEKRRYVDLQNQTSADIGEIKGQFEQYKRANVDTGTLKVRFEAERASLNSQLIQQRERIDELEKRLNLVMEENDKMRQIYENKIKEFDQVKKEHRLQEEKWHEEKGDLEREIEQQKRTALDVKELTIKLSSEKAHHENQVAQLKIINENGKQELEKLYELMTQRKKEYDHYLKQNEDLKKEVERLNKQIRQNDNANNTKNDKYMDLERTIKELERERDLYKEQNERFNSKLQVSHADIEGKILELDMSKRKYDEAIAKISTQLDTEFGKKLVNTSSTPNGNSSTKSFKFGFISTTDV